MLTPCSIGTDILYPTSFLASTWEPPPEGYISIKEQERLSNNQEKKETKKVNTIKWALGTFTISRFYTTVVTN